MKSLKKKSDIIITHQDEGGGVVLLQKKDYVDKMLDILKDKSKFTRLGSCADHDGSARVEKSLQETWQRKARSLTKSTSGLDPLDLYGPSCIAFQRSTKKISLLDQSFR